MLRIVAYSDYVCPWCYIGFQRVEQLQRDFGLPVEWRPFELHPETPVTGADLRGRLGNSQRVRAYTGNILALAHESGLEMHMPQVVANSHRALEAAEFAREHAAPEVYQWFHRALFRAYFEDGRDVADVETLCDIARDAGVDDQGLRAALFDERYTAAIDVITESARRAEILSTPTFVFTTDPPSDDRTTVPEGFRLTGAQDYNVFTSITQRLLARMGGAPQPEA